MFYEINIPKKYNMFHRHWLLECKSYALSYLFLSSSSILKVASFNLRTALKRILLLNTNEQDKSFHSCFFLQKEKYIMHIVYKQHYLL